MASIDDLPHVEVTDIVRQALCVDDDRTKVFVSPRGQMTAAGRRLGDPPVGPVDTP